MSDVMDGTWLTKPQPFGQPTCRVVIGGRFYTMDGIRLDVDAEHVMMERIGNVPTTGPWEAWRR